jgi:hypothetical protein
MSEEISKTKKKKFVLSDWEKYDSNPFVEQAIDQIQGHVVKKYRNATNTGEKAVLQAFDGNTGEVLGHTSFVRQIEVDEDQFTKIYLNNFSAFFGIKEAGIRVFGYIMTRMVPGQDLVIFLMNEAVEYTGYKSKNSIWRGLGELVENKIIARGPSESLYYINPMVVFNGNRVTFAKTYIKKKKQLNNPNQKSLDFPSDT